MFIYLYEIYFLKIPFHFLFIQIFIAYYYIKVPSDVYIQIQSKEVHHNDETCLCTLTVLRVF